MFKVVIKRNHIKKRREDSFHRWWQRNQSGLWAGSGSCSAHQLAGCLQRRKLPDKEHVDVAEALKVALFFRMVPGTHSTCPRKDSIFTPRNW